MPNILTEIAALEHLSSELEMVPGVRRAFVDAAANRVYLICDAPDPGVPIERGAAEVLARAGIAEGVGELGLTRVRMVDYTAMMKKRKKNNDKENKAVKSNTDAKTSEASAEASSSSPADKAVPTSTSAAIADDTIEEEPEVDEEPAAKGKGKTKAATKGKSKAKAKAT